MSVRCPGCGRHRPRLTWRGVCASCGRRQDRRERARQRRLPRRTCGNARCTRRRRFTPKRVDQVYCSKQCRQAAYRDAKFGPATPRASHDVAPRNIGTNVPMSVSKARDDAGMDRPSAPRGADAQPDRAHDLPPRVRPSLPLTEVSLANGAPPGGDYPPSPTTPDGRSRRPSLLAAYKYLHWLKDDDD